MILTEVPLIWVSGIGDKAGMENPAVLFPCIMKEEVKKAFSDQERDVIIIQIFFKIQ
jgi:hypothetical protein